MLTPAAVERESTKAAGAASTTLAILDGDAEEPENANWKLASPTGLSCGNCAFTCHGLTDSIGSARPFMRTCTPSKVFGRGNPWALVTRSPVRFVPKTVINEPTDAAAPETGLTTPFGLSARG